MRRGGIFFSPCADVHLFVYLDRGYIGPKDNIEKNALRLLFDFIDAVLGTSTPIVLQIHF